VDHASYLYNIEIDVNPIEYRVWEPYEWHTPNAGFVSRTGRKRKKDQSFTCASDQIFDAGADGTVTRNIRVDFIDI
jgi:hypothetical protein